MKRSVIFATALGILVLATLWAFSLQETTLEIKPENVIIDPYDRNLLSAEIVFETPFPALVTVTVESRGASDSDFMYVIEGIRTKHTIPVWGLYANHDNNVKVTFRGKYGKKAQGNIVIATTVDENIQSVKTSGNSDFQQFPLLFLANGTMFDKQGNIRLLFSGKEEAFYPLSAGFFAAESADRTEVIIITAVGKEVARYSVPYKAHHEIIEKTPGGNLLIATNHANERFLDAIIEVDRVSGEIVKTWDLRNYFDESRPTLARRGLGAWFHLNSIQYDPLDNTILVSGRSQNVVAKIGYDDKKVHWILGNHQQWKPAYSQYLLTPTNFATDKNSDQDWTYLQHTATIQPSNRILIFDNGAGRPGFNSTSTPFGETAEGGYVRIVEYQVDEQEKTVTKTFEYTDFPNIESIKKGSVYTVGDDYLLIGYGEFNSVTLIRKSTQEKLFEADFGEGNFYRVYPIVWKTLATTFTRD